MQLEIWPPWCWLVWSVSWALKWSCLPLSPIVSGCLPLCGGWVLVGVAAFLGSEVVLSPVVSGCLPSCGGWGVVGVAASRTKIFRNQNHRLQSKFAYCKLFGVYAGVICFPLRLQTQEMVGWILECWGGAVGVASNLHRERLIAQHHLIPGRALKVLAELPLPLHAENEEVERRRADTVNGAVVDGDACLRPFFVVLLFQNEKVQKEKLQAIGRWWFFTPFCFTKTSDRFPPIWRLFPH